MAEATHRRGLTIDLDVVSSAEDAAMESLSGLPPFWEGIFRSCARYGSVVRESGDVVTFVADERSEANALATVFVTSGEPSLDVESDTSLVLRSNTEAASKEGWGDWPANTTLYVWRVPHRACSPDTGLQEFVAGYIISTATRSESKTFAVSMSSVTPDPETEAARWPNWHSMFADSMGLDAPVPLPHDGPAAAVAAVERSASGSTVAASGGGFFFMFKSVVSA